MTSPAPFLLELDPAGFAVGLVTSGQVDDELRAEYESLKIPRLLLAVEADELLEEWTADADDVLALAFDGLDFLAASEGSSTIRAHGAFLARLAEVVQDVRFGELAENDRPLGRAIAYRCEVVRHALIAANTGVDRGQLRRALEFYGLDDDAARLFASST